MKKHVFISYSRKNSDFANDLTQYLDDELIPYWIDRQGISNADRSFEQKLRESMEDAWGAILIASPESLSSDFVQGEIDIIRERDIPLVILWAAGDYYTDTVPTSLTRKSYIDCRDDAKDAGFSALLPALQAMWDAVPLFQPIEARKFVPLLLGEFELRLPDDTVVRTHKKRFDTIEDFFVQLYRQYLHTTFSPYSYGVEWVIVTRLEFGSLTIGIPFITPHALVDNKHNWRKNSLSDYDLANTLSYSQVFSLHETSAWEIIATAETITFEGTIEPRDVYKFVAHKFTPPWRRKALGLPELEEITWAEAQDMPMLVLMARHIDTDNKRFRFLRLVSE